MKYDLLYRKRWLLFYGPLLVLIVALLYLSFTRWLPQAPSSLTIVSGLPNDSYSKLAYRYRTKLEEMGIKVEIVNLATPHTGLQQVDKLKQSSGDHNQLAFVSGLLAPARPATSIAASGSGSAASASLAQTASPTQASVMALAAIEREPVWVFTRVANIKQLSDIHSHRIAVPAQDTLSQQAAKLLTAVASSNGSGNDLVPVASDQIANDLIDGKVDVVIMLASVDSEAVKVLLRSDNISLIGVNAASSVIAREPRLRPFVLPQGVIEFRGNIPSQDLSLLSADLHLVISPEMHPALQRAILDVASEIHELPSYLHRQAEFPSVAQLDFMPTSVALAGIRGDKPLAELLLPYGWAQNVQWLVFAFFPIVLLTGLLLLWLPKLLSWKTNSMLQSFYGELKFLESDIEAVNNRPIEMKKLLQQIDAIEIRVMQLDLPVHQSERWYTLRTHLSQARDKLLGLRAR
jgi:hypothetical protein